MVRIPQRNGVESDTIIRPRRAKGKGAAAPAPKPAPKPEPKPEGKPPGGTEPKKSKTESVVNGMSKASDVTSAANGLVQTGVQAWDTVKSIFSPQQYPATY
jgi:hypothetical protein